VLVLRLAPAALRGLLRLASARPGVTAFVALARAARAALGATLPAFALVLALTVVAFGFLIRGAVQRGEVAQSWRVNGADAVVSLTRVPDGVTPAEQRVIAAVPGARLTVAASVTTASPGSGPPVDVVIADPARYAALTATTPYPPLTAAARLARLARPASQAAGQATAGTAAPVLASPSVAARLGRGPASLQTALGTVSVRVAGTLPSTPAVPGSAGFVILPDWAAARLAPHPPSELLISGDSVSRPALAAAIRRAAPQATVAYRADVLAGLAGAPLPHGAYVAFAEGSVAAAGFCVLVMLLSLLLAARSRQLTLARLATMGLGPGQARRLVVAEALPPVLAAAVAGVACALALAPLLAPELDLSAFTGSAAGHPGGRAGRPGGGDAGRAGRAGQPPQPGQRPADHQLSTTRRRHDRQHGPGDQPGRARRRVRAVPHQLRRGRADRLRPAGQDLRRRRHRGAGPAGPGPARAGR
jgi:putative ABC transport system permease protein